MKVIRERDETIRVTTEGSPEEFEELIAALGPGRKSRQEKDVLAKHRYQLAQAAGVELAIEPADDDDDAGSSNKE